LSDGRFACFAIKGLEAAFLRKKRILADPGFPELAQIGATAASSGFFAD
jgi:hypothetical protein